MKAPSGTLARVISSQRKIENGVPVTEVQVDECDGDITTVDLYQPPGEDSLPLPGDNALLQESPGLGVKACVGFHDPVNQGSAGDGEKRVYARQPNGQPAVEYWLKANGDAVIKGYVASGKLLIDWPGTVVIKSPDVRVGDETASRPVACVGDMISGSIRGLCGGPGSPLVPVPPSAPTPSGGVPFVGQIISGSPRAKAT